MLNTPESIIEHEPKYHSNSWKQYTVAELGQWVHLLVKRAYHRSDMQKRAKDLNDAQNYLNMMQAHINAAVVIEPNEILEQLPMVGDPPTAEKLESGMRLLRIEKAWEADGREIPEPESTAFAEPEPEPKQEGPPRDEAGNVTRISTQVGDSGYDPEIHLNLELKILCDGVHIPTAHTADIVAGTIWYYEKNAQGRIKTLTKQGRVEIRGL